VTPWQGGPSVHLECGQDRLLSPQPVQADPPWLLTVAEAATGRVILQQSYSPTDVPPGGQIRLFIIPGKISLEPSPTRAEGSGPRPDCSPTATPSSK
jgi:hypothetical protein